MLECLRVRNAARADAKVKATGPTPSSSASSSAQQALGTAKEHVQPDTIEPMAPPSSATIKAHVQQNAVSSAPSSNLSPHVQNTTSKKYAPKSSDTPPEPIPSVLNTPRISENSKAHDDALAIKQEILGKKMSSVPMSSPAGCVQKNNLSQSGSKEFPVDLLSSDDEEMLEGEGEEEVPVSKVTWMYPHLHDPNPVQNTTPPVTALKVSQSLAGISSTSGQINTQASTDRPTPKPAEPSYKTRGPPGAKVSKTRPERSVPDIITEYSDGIEWRYVPPAKAMQNHSRSVADYCGIKYDPHSNANTLKNVEESSTAAVGVLVQSFCFGANLFRNRHHELRFLREPQESPETC